MKNVITVKTMRESDAHTIADYVPSKELMRRAALGVYRAVEWKGRIGILAGSGNNGGDGYALACILADHEIRCTVYQVLDKCSEDGAFYRELALSKGVEILPFDPKTDLHGFDILVDCMLGTGFSGRVKGNLRPAIKAINNAHAYVVSVDINSGMNGDTGKAELAVKADLTVTIGYLKTGLFLGDSIWYVDKIVIADIGIRLIRDEYQLASMEEIVFPHTGFRPDQDPGEILTPGEAEAMAKRGQGIPQAAMDQARKEKRMVRVLGQKPFVTDGDRGYFLNEGVFPETIDCKE